MKNACFSCGQHFPGLNWFIPDAQWKAIAGPLNAGELCPWCADTRLRAAGITVKPKISLSLPNFDALNFGVIAELEALDSRVMREAVACS